jgi:hypothetical protein
MRREKGSGCSQSAFNKSSQIHTFFSHVKQRLFVSKLHMQSCWLQFGYKYLLYTASTSIFCGGGYGFEVGVLARDGFIGKEGVDVILGGTRIEEGRIDVVLTGVRKRGIEEVLAGVEAGKGGTDEILAGTRIKEGGVDVILTRVRKERVEEVLASARAGKGEVDEILAETGIREEGTDDVLAVLKLGKKDQMWFWLELEKEKQMTF